MPGNNEQIQLIIEQICVTGCDRVNEVIEILERDENIEETKLLSAEECDIILHDLKSIMAIYEQQ